MPCWSAFTPRGGAGALWPHRENRPRREDRGRLRLPQSAGIRAGGSGFGCIGWRTGVDHSGRCGPEAVPVALPEPLTDWRSPSRPVKAHRRVGCVPCPTRQGRSGDLRSRHIQGIATTQEPGRSGGQSLVQQGRVHRMFFGAACLENETSQALPLRRVAELAGQSARHFNPGKGRQMDQRAGRQCMA